MTSHTANNTSPNSNLRVLDSAQLFDRHSTVIIVHRGEHYTLRLTASNKLILTK